jgi:hypothetical protein
MFLLNVSNKDLQLEEHLIAAFDVTLIFAAVKPGLLPYLTYPNLIQPNTSYPNLTNPIQPKFSLPDNQPERCHVSSVREQ